MALFVDLVRGQPTSGIVADVGSGIGHVTAELFRLGLDVIGVEPSAGMRALAMTAHPECRFIDDDARLSGPGMTAELSGQQADNPGAGHPGADGQGASALEASLLDASPLEASLLGAIVARYSLIHVEPSAIQAVVTRWATLLPAGGTVLIAGQASDEPGHVEFDHQVARAWRWHPDTFSMMLRQCGFDEQWRMISRPDTTRRFPEFHLAATRR